MFLSYVPVNSLVVFLMVLEPSYFSRDAFLGIVGGG